jgi:7-cyano-7-deazaguanine synthase
MASTQEPRPRRRYSSVFPDVPGTVVLVSGGVDSTVLLYQLAERQRAGELQVHPLFIDYAQRAARLEYEAIYWHCRRLSMHLTTLDLNRVGEAFGRARSMKPHVPLPHRNLVVLGLAVSYATVAGANALSLGVISDDGTRYPSAAPPFLEAFAQVARTLAVSFETPFAHWSKAQVVAEGARLGVDFGQTYSCMLGRELHCGHCTQCQRRDSALGTLRRFPPIGS